MPNTTINDAYNYIILLKRTIIDRVMIISNKIDF